MRNYMDKSVTPPQQVTSPTWGPPPPCKQFLRNEKESGADMLPGIVSGILNRDFKIQRCQGNENVS